MGLIGFVVAWIKWELLGTACICLELPSVELHLLGFVWNGMDLLGMALHRLEFLRIT